MSYVDDLDIKNADEAASHLTVLESMVRSKKRYLEENGVRENFRQWMLDEIEKWENRVERLKELWPNVKER